MRHADGRGPRTSLTPMVFDRLNVTRADEIVSEVYEGAERRQLVATLGSLVAEAQAAGDAVAAEILADAATELVMAAASVIGRLGMRGHVFSTFLSGGMFRSLPWLAAEVTSRLREVAPRTAVSLLTAEPAAGAVTLARAEAAGQARVPAYLDAVAAQS
jgi:N-acetylglucosamine kinase-like BadF-type ATPase